MTARYSTPLYLGETELKTTAKTAAGEFVEFQGGQYYKIHNVDALPPFFISIVSSSDHWLFISSTGGLSTGRISADHALFPYYTEDKLTENSENTGNKSIFIINRNNHASLWEPFSIRQQSQYRIERNLYKHTTGSALIFEEINIDLGLTYRYAWRTGERFGFIKTSWLIEHSDAECQVEILDGIQNILPANVLASTQNNLSLLLDAYKRLELDLETGLAICALSSTLTDLAEPSESLLATTVYQIGLECETRLLSSNQLDRFRTGQAIETEKEIRGRRGAYFAHSTQSLVRGGELCWHIVADVDQDASAIVESLSRLRADRTILLQEIEQDIEANMQALERIVAAADGLQTTADQVVTSHHFANVLFNEMRGGIFADQYQVDKADFIQFVSTHQRNCLQTHAEFFATLPPKLHITDLYKQAEAHGSVDIIRLSYTYLPLGFSRRHGDPSRPWNRFTINIKNADGSPRLDYEGNWRDIFQNWEALAYSFPEFVEAMIFNFLSATTADGYNPYRITRDCIEWEVLEEGNQWSNIGYWSDHQIIYLQKLMEISAKVHPGRLQDFLNRPLLSCANVPYRIKSYADMVKDPYKTILFDHQLEKEITTNVKTIGADGKLVMRNGQVLYQNLTEKLLTLLLAKLVNFVPEGGIWMNTQRPEWNDANNALVGKGISVVTLGYLRRYIAFLQGLLAKADMNSVKVSVEIATLFQNIFDILKKFEHGLSGSFTDEMRDSMMTALGQAGSDYRWAYYERGFSDQSSDLPCSDLESFLKLTQDYVEHSLRANRRADELFHSYNILQFGKGCASIRRLDVMLEGQVSILSSQMLSGKEALVLLDALRHSPLYREDQHTYLLYPDKTLLGFLEKNRIPEEKVRSLKLVKALLDADDASLMSKDSLGFYHFNGGIHSIKDVERILGELSARDGYAHLIAQETEDIKSLFEEIFHHSKFTGRSGTFFAYEGLGSVYWHMVAKLLLAVQEVIFYGQDEEARAGLIQKYKEIRAGLGFNKSPAAYGAFPTDPYSHTPKGQGAKQPGMTGLVKEEILTRQVELGLTIRNGCISFDLQSLDRNELMSHPTEFSYYDVNGVQKHIQLPAESLAFTICQIPVTLNKSTRDEIILQFKDGSTHNIQGHVIDGNSSASIFLREGKIQDILVRFQ
jgi:hypothetical protein